MAECASTGNRLILKYGGLVQGFLKHLDDCDARNRDKLTKRYLTVLSKLASPDAIQIALELFLKGPGLREPAIRYISGLPFSRQTASAFRKLIKQVPRYDDMAKLLVVRGIVEHRVPKDARGRRFVSAISNSLGDAKTPFDWYAKFLLLSKYGEQHEVLTAFEKSRGVLRRDSFLARQAMAVLSRAAGVNFDKVYRSWQQEVSRGVADSASVAVNLMTFADTGFPSKGNRAYPYLFPKDARGAYPIPKFLLLCVIAASEHKAGKKVARPEVEKFVVDPWMQSAIRAINPLWFATKGKK